MKKSKGFTLIELIIVVAILSILISLTIFFVSSNKQDSEAADAVLSAGGKLIGESVKGALSDEDININSKNKVSVSKNNKNGINDNKIGVNDNKIGANDNKIGINDVSDNKIGVNDNIVGNENNINNITNNYYNDDGTTERSLVFTPSVSVKYSYNGVDWKDKVMEFEVGSHYYMEISVAVKQSISTDKENIIKAEITLPTNGIMDYNVVQYQGADELKSEKNDENNTEKYSFDIISGMSPEPFSIVFEFEPLELGDAPISISYDKKLNSSWNKKMILKFV